MCNFFSSVMAVKVFTGFQRDFMVNFAASRGRCGVFGGNEKLIYPNSEMAWPQKNAKSAKSGSRNDFSGKKSDGSSSFSRNHAAGKPRMDTNEHESEARSNDGFVPSTPLLVSGFAESETRLLARFYSCPFVVEMVRHGWWQPGGDGTGRRPFRAFGRQARKR